MKFLKFMGLKKVIVFILQHPISGRSKIKSIIRFFWWQIRNLFIKKSYIHQFTENSKLYVGKGMTGATGNLYCGLHEYREMMFVLHLLRSNDLFVDIGANIGSYTILASAEVGSKSFSFEPIPITFKQLKENVVLNNIGSKVTLLNIGLASKKGKLYFSNEKDTSLNHVEIINSNNNLIPIEVDTLDNKLSGLNPLLLKIDVEGFEFDILKGASNVIDDNNLKAIIIELNGSGVKYGYNDVDIEKFLNSFGFHAYIYDPFSRILESAKLHDSDNLIYIRDFEFIKHRINSARKFKILDLEI